MQKWEYLGVERTHTHNYKSAKLENINGEDIVGKDRQPFHPYLQELGKEGWELVDVQESTFYFKRPIE